MNRTSIVNFSDKLMPLNCIENLHLASEVVWKVLF